MEKNSLLDKLKLPGRTFQLPSRGAFYKNGEISSIDGEIHVHPMSALAEISLKNPDLLFNGKAIEQVFAECIPEIKKPTELYGRDIDAIMFYLRLVTYGPNFEIKIKHTCENAKEHSHIVNIESLITEKMRFLDPTIAIENFTVTLPNEQVVKVHPMKFEHLMKLFQQNTGKQDFTPDDVKKNIVFSLTNLIESVDGIIEKPLIQEWVTKLTTPYQNRITEAIEKTNEWGPTQVVDMTCRDCGNEMKIELPMNPQNFFTE